MHTQEDEAKAQMEADKVKEIKDECEADLAQAMPAYESAIKVLAGVHTFNAHRPSASWKPRLFNAHNFAHTHTHAHTQTHTHTHTHTHAHTMTLMLTHKITQVLSLAKELRLCWGATFLGVCVARNIIRNVRTRKKRRPRQ